MLLQLLKKMPVVLLLLLGNRALAQVQLRGTNGAVGQRPQVGYDAQGRPIKKAGGQDSLQRRDRNADSITIFFKYYDSSRLRTIDSSINDFTTRFPLPYYYHSLGNYSTASQSFFFNPLMKAGFDAGFHQYDIYAFTLENTKLYQSTRPYTELAYVLGSKAEQLVNVLHTQNKKSNFNFSLEYRFNNAPGFLKTQNASQNNMRFVAHYQTLNKKYEVSFIYISNKSASSENGGLQSPSKLDSLALNDPYELETRLGRPGRALRNPFNTTVNTGNTYKNSNLVIQHHYDLGTKDSLVTDSVTYRLFYPRFRIEHILRIGSSSYQFLDNFPDSTNYARYFNAVPGGTTVRYYDAWNELNNEFSLISFPQKNNLAQFLKAGVAIQNLKGTFDTTSTTRLYNFSVLSEYRNRTRNQLWDIEAKGQFYITGFNSGDYEAYISMQRMLGRKLGYLRIGFQNVNRSPSYILNPASSFPVKNRGSYAKENIIRFFASYDHPKGWKFGGEYFAVTNYMYYDSFFSAKQHATLFNVLHLTAEKKFKLARYWNLYTEIHVQQAPGQDVLNIPTVLTRNRLAFEGNFATNLFLSTGLELIYNTAYKADNYSPFIGQYFVQNTSTISNRPTIDAFVHFRIKSFKGFFRLENLNTINLKTGSFNKLNFAADKYPYTGLWLRFGLWWNFVN
ncbi:putative porin [Sediminibacterium roseum]|uniref:Porin n=1 Tax=Sediminibacterium roseum TaxID=1978412 RepID=A0ABW9ZUH7_9BACT|nr:putative porin [Sediminibacterium roseum]NCI50664.1 putative porin [Sediminibacterium roseum]